MSRYENYEIKNNVFGTLSAPISSLATTIQLATGQGQRFTADMLATLESMEGNKVTKREIVKITNVTGDTLTVIRKFAPCPSSDDANTQGQVSYSFSTDDTISVYISKEHFDKIDDGFTNTNTEIDDIYTNGDHRVRAFATTGLGIEVTSGNVIVGNTQGFFNGSTLTLTDNATNYIMITTGLSIFVSLSGRENDKARVAEITTANGEITNIKDMKIDTIGGTLGGGGGNTAIKVPAMENITDGKFCSLVGYCVNKSYPLQNFEFGTNTNRKYAIKCYGNGIVGDTIKLRLGYNGNTNNNITISIQSDSGGKPSGNLINNNATKTIQKSNLIAAGGLYTITFGSSFAIPKGVNRIVLEQTTDNTNYSFIGGEGMSYGFGAIYDGFNRTEATGLSSDTYSKYQSSGSSYASSGTKTCTIIPLTDCVFTGMNGYSTSNKFNLKQGGTTLISNGEYNTYTYNIPLTAGVTYTIDCIVGTNSPFNSTAATDLNIGNFIINAEQFQCAMPSGGLQIHYKLYKKVNVICESSLVYGQVAAISSNTYDYITEQMGFAKTTATEGTDIEIITGGEFENENLSIIPGQEYYLGTNGDLTDTRGDIIVTVGSGITNNSISLSIKKYITIITDYVNTALFSGLIFIGRGPNDTTYNSVAYLDNNNATTQVLNPYRDDCSIEAYKGQRFKIHLGNTGTRIAYKSY